MTNRQPVTDAGRKPNPEAVRRIVAHLWGEDFVNLRAAVESFANGWTVVTKAEAQAQLSEPRTAELVEALRRHSTDPLPYCDDGSHHVLNLARNVLAARPGDGTCDHCGQIAPCTERRIAEAFVEVMDAALAATDATAPDAEREE